MSGYVLRMRGYLGEMLPLPTHLFVAALTYLGIAGFGSRAHGATGSVFSAHTLIGVWSVFNLFLILRLMDEIKDCEIDRRLFPERPLPSGRVRRSDIEISLIVAIAAYLAANLVSGAAFWTALVVLAYTVLMFTLFFVPDILRANLPLSLATHTPIVPLMLLQGFSIFADQNGLQLIELRWAAVAPFVVMIWAGFVSWELARKIRPAAAETAYVTYSRILGPVGAVATLSGVQLVAFLIGAILALRLSLPWTYVAVLSVGLAVASITNLRFVAGGVVTATDLRRAAEINVVALLVAQVVGLGFFG